MSTGIEIIPFYLAFAGLSCGYKALMYTAEKLGNYADNTARLKEARQNQTEAPPIIHLQYDEDSESPRGVAPEHDVDTNWDELCGDFNKNHISETVKTVMNDEDLLLAALDDYGLQFEMLENEIRASAGQKRVTFVKDENGVYDATFVAGTNEEVQSMSQDLTELYTMKVQQRVYENLTSRALEKGLVFETEEVHDDNSIVLTFVVRE